MLIVTVTTTMPTTMAAMVRTIATTTMVTTAMATWCREREGGYLRDMAGDIVYLLEDPACSIG